MLVRVAKDRAKSVKLPSMKSTSQSHWEFRSAEDVSRFWEKHRHVPGRANGREHHHEERHYLALYLLALANNQLLTYPFQVDQSKEHESPDFMFSWNSGETTGFEVTRATQEEFQCELSLAERSYQQKYGKVIASGEAPQEILPVLGWSDERVDDLASGEAPKFLPPAGWAGDDAERQLCRSLIDTIEKKIAKLRCGKYRPAATYELLIFEHANLPATDRQKMLTAMHSRVRDLQTETPTFRKVSVALPLDVIFDIGGESRVFRYIEPPNLDDPESLHTFSEHSTYAAWFSAERAVQEHRRMGRPVYSTDDKGRTIKETPDGRFEVRLEKDGTETIIKELPH